VDQSSALQNSRKSQLALLVITVVALAPFLNKAFHIDDPLFLWIAQQITKHPFDPYGFSVNWSTSAEPMWKVMQNPPLCSYFIAAIAAIAGWSEPALHLAFLVWPVLSVLATFAISRRFCREPFLAALLTLFTPAFLVSATNIMCDLMLLALWLWSIECWIAGLERRIWLPLVVSAILAAAASLTKYFGISVVPLLVAYTLARDRRLAVYLVPLLLPVAAIVAFELTTQAHYGVGLLTGAVSLSRSMLKLGPFWFAQFLTGLAFTGGCLISALPYLARRQWRFWGIAVVAIIIFLTLFYIFVPLYAFYALGQNTWLVQVEGGLFATIGAAILAFAVADLVRYRDASSLLLFLWVLGTFSFATFCNWSITGRTILPMAPACAILSMRWWTASRRAESTLLRYVGVFFAATVSLIIAAADYRQAESARDASHKFQERFQADPGTTWFESHWGFQYYMQQWGAQALDAAGSEIQPNDVLVLPSNNTAVVPLPLEKLSPFETVDFPLPPFFSTHGRGTGAAFYSSTHGPIPWAIDHVRPETYYVARFR
jgi:hypothetical protein